MVDNPFNPGEKVVAVPVPKLDCSVIHVQKASPDGTCVIEGDEFHDVDIAVAAKRTIVTCEELVSDEYIRRDPEKNKVFGACVSAVVHVPYGAWPSQCYNYYDCDDAAMKEYDQASKEEESFKAYVKKYYYDVKDNDELLNVIGGARLAHLKVVPGLGYAIR